MILITVIKKDDEAMKKQLAQGLAGILRRLSKLVERTCKGMSFALFSKVEKCAVIGYTI